MIKSKSTFKNPAEDHLFFKNWVSKLEKLNQTSYEQIDLNTSLGKTICWAINKSQPHLKTLVIFPGFRTCSLFWDFDNALENLKKMYRIFMIDTNGQPCLSEGNTPDIKSDGYGLWAAEVLEQLNIRKAVVAGASFGGLVCLKLAMIAPGLIEKVILLNPGCLRSFSLSFKNIYYNLLPLLAPSSKNVKKFLDNAVFCKPVHQLSTEAEKMLIDYEVFALTRFTDKAQKPYSMDEDELRKVKGAVYLLVGDHDILFPYKKSLDRARSFIYGLQETFVLKNTGHGIETSKEAMSIIKHIMEA
ncbi:MAG: alpha/beta fold hydrolase [Chitinophagaceae bacterium]